MKATATLANANGEFYPPEVSTQAQSAATAGISHQPKTILTTTAYAVGEMEFTDVWDGLSDHLRTTLSNQQEHSYRDLEKLNLATLPEYKEYFSSVPRNKYGIVPICFDIDGTLTNGGRAISLAKQQALRELIDAIPNARLIVASARPIRDIIPLFHPHTLMDAYVMGCNGATIYYIPKQAFRPATCLLDGTCTNYIQLKQESDYASSQLKGLYLDSTESDSVITEEEAEGGLAYNLPDELKPERESALSPEEFERLYGKESALDVLEQAASRQGQAASKQGHGATQTKGHTKAHTKGHNPARKQAFSAATGQAKVHTKPQAEASTCVSQADPDYQVDFLGYLADHANTCPAAFSSKEIKGHPGLAALAQHELANGGGTSDEAGVPQVEHYAKQREQVEGSASGRLVLDQEEVELPTLPELAAAAATGLIDYQPLVLDIDKIVCLQDVVLDPEYVTKALDTARKLGIAFVLDSHFEFAVSEMYHPFHDYIRDLNDVHPQNGIAEENNFEISLEQMLAKGKVQKILLLLDKPELEQTTPFNHEGVAVTLHSDCFDVSVEGTNKYKSIVRVFFQDAVDANGKPVELPVCEGPDNLDQDFLNQDRVLYFAAGNDRNDLEMLRHAYLACSFHKNLPYQHSGVRSFGHIDEIYGFFAEVRRALVPAEA